MPQQRIQIAIGRAGGELRREARGYDVHARAAVVFEVAGCEFGVARDVERCLRHRDTEEVGEVRAVDAAAPAQAEVDELEAPRLAPARACATTFVCQAGDGSCHHPSLSRIITR